MKNLVLINVFLFMVFESFCQVHYDTEQIGETNYLLQTESSMTNRLFVYDDGTIGATWMLGFEDPDFGDLGTGYNYYYSDWGPFPDERIETHIARSPAYAPYGQDGEITVSFSDDPSIQLEFNKRTTKGNGSWESFNLLGPDGYQLSYPAMVTNGSDLDTIHLLAITTGVNPREQEHQLLYYRSSDGGQSWDIEAHTFEGLGNNYLSTIKPNTYAWAEPRAGVMAFSVGFTSEDGFIMKSTDNGDTWEKIDVYENPYSPYSGGATNKFGGGDGSQALAIDNNGMTHVTFGRMVYYYDENDSLICDPLTSGLVYWNENMEVLDTTRISSFTTDSLEAHKNLVKGTSFDSDSISVFHDYGCKSLASFPQISVDDENMIHFIWSMIAPGFESTEGATLRHIWYRIYDAYEDTWMPPSDITGDIFHLHNESVYPTIFNQRDDLFMHIVYLTYEETPTNGISIGEASVVEHTLYYYGLIGISENDQPNTFTVSDNYPNPFSGKTTVHINCNRPTTLTLNIYSILGETVLSRNLGHFGTGLSTIKIADYNLNDGIYFYSISDGKNTIVKKMIVE